MNRSKLMEKASYMEEILLNEIDNRRYIHLYLVGDTWCAFERSAYYLVAMEFPVNLEEIIYDDCVVILLKASFAVDEMRLPLSPSVALITMTDDHLCFQMDKKIGGFSEWKDKQLEDK